MIFRAIFWIGLVSLLMPHEPDLGLGRPGADASLPSRLASLATSGLAKPGQACSAACAGGLGLLDMVQGATVRSLAQVKAEIDASVRARRERE
ncbi:MAG TPA: hypothetical protein VIJ72_04100 [Rhizomicrobium sp.]